MNNTGRIVSSTVVRVFLVAMLLLISGTLVWSQTTASIVGTVQDASGGAVRDAMVTVTSLETGVTRNATSENDGTYRVLSLPVGAYEIRAEKSGFRTIIQSGIHLEVGQVGVVNLTLEVGQVQQQVTVTSEAPLVNTTTSSISGLVGEKEVKELPLNGRSFDMLITLNAGAANITSEKGSGVSAQSGNMFSISGRRWGENLFLWNGVEYTGPSLAHSIPGGVSGQLLGIDAVREFNVVSEAYGAEYGKRAGAQISVVTQSGTNQLHGTVFEFLRNSVLDARNYFDHPVNSAGLAERIPPFKRNQFGGALGGPIQKNKTFVFGNYEGFRQRLGISDVTIVPDANARTGLLPCNVINPTGVGCAANSKNDTTPTKVPGLAAGMLAYMAYWPAPNGPDLGAGQAEAFSNPLESIREDFGTVRVDHTFSDRDQLGVGYMIDDGYNLTPMTDPFFASVTSIRSQVLSLQETHIFSPNLINTFTAGFSRSGFVYLNPAIGAFPSSLLFVPGTPPGRISIGGGNSSGNSTLTLAGGTVSPKSHDYRTPLTFEDGVQVVKGRHQISAGVWFQPLRSFEYPFSSGSGSATFTSLTTFLQGTVGTFSVGSVETPLHWSQFEGAWYVQDVIQLRPNLTVRLGLRHEFTNGWNEAHGRSSNFVYNTGGVELPGSVLITSPIVGTSPYTENNSKWLFGPRVGIAWDPFGNGKTSVRAGFGTHYDFIDDLMTLLDRLPPFNSVASFTNVPFLSLVPINPSTPFPPGCSPGVPTPCTTLTPGGIQSNVKIPTVEEWNFTVQQGITTNTSLSVSYVGSHGFHQLSTANSNSLETQTCSNAAGCTSGGVGTTTGTVPAGAVYLPVEKRPNSFLANGNMLYSNDNSNYNALEVEVTDRFSSGLQFKGAYTWSRDLDFQTGWGSGDNNNNAMGLLDPYNPRLDYGPSAQNVTNKLAFSGGYELPFGPNKPWLNAQSGVEAKLLGGWQVNWILTVRSGLPFDPTAGSNRSGNGDSNAPDRPSWNPAFAGPIITGNPKQWYNPNAFILPVAGTYGNVGRDALLGPGLGELDLSLFKTTSINERFKAEFRAEAFNLLNRANFYGPALPVFSGTTISTSAGVLTGTATTSRQLQFGLKLMF